jgi:hypothetical protein
MSLSLKQSKLRLASSKIENDDLTVGLKEVRAQKVNKKKSTSRKATIWRRSCIKYFLI